MTARPEEAYEVKGDLDNPFTALNKEEKRKKQAEEQRRRDAEIKAKEDQARAEKEAKKEEARKLKEQELAEKIKQRTVETEKKLQEETKRKAEEKAAAEAKRAAEESKKQQEKEAAALKKRIEEEERKRRKEEEERSKKQQAEAEKAAAREKREQQLKEEEALAGKRAQEIAESRDLQKRVEEAKKKGQLPENFIPIVWGLSDAERREIEDILEKPYWEAPQPAQPWKATKAAPVVGGEVVKSTVRSSDPWWEDKRSVQANLWSGNMMQVVANFVAESTPILPPTATSTATEKVSLVQKYQQIVRKSNEPPVSSEKQADTSLESVSRAKGQSAALWAAIEKGERVQAPSYTGHTLEGFGKVKLHKDVEDVIELVAMMATDGQPAASSQPQQSFMENADIADIAKSSHYGRKDEVLAAAGIREESHYSANIVNPASFPTGAAAAAATADGKGDSGHYGRKGEFIPASASASSKGASKEDAESPYGPKGGSILRPSTGKDNEGIYGRKDGKGSEYGTKASLSEKIASDAAEANSSALEQNPYGKKGTLGNASTEAAAQNPYGKKGTLGNASTEVAAQNAYGKKGTLNDPATSSNESSEPSSPSKTAFQRRLSEMPYGSKAVVASKENDYGTKMAPNGSAATVDGQATSSAAKKESVYGTSDEVKAAAAAVAAASSAEPEESVATRVASAKATWNSIAGKSQESSAPVPAPAPAQPAAPAPAASAAPRVNYEYQYSQFNAKQQADATAAAPAPAPVPAPAPAPAAAAPRPSLSQVTLSAEQIAAMVNQMTPQQQQQAYMMLKTAVSKGHPLSPQQQQLLAALETRLQQLLAAARAHAEAQGQGQGAAATAAAPSAGSDGAGAQGASSPPAASAAAPSAGASAPSDDSTAAGAGPGATGAGEKRGLFFVLPKKEKFQFGIPGREIITLRHFDRIPSKKSADREKVLMVICNDIAFVCKQTPGEAAGTYELFDKPTQRDKVKAEDSKEPNGFVLKLNKESHTLVANSKEEKLYWIQLINTRANFVPTNKLPEHAAAKAQGK